MIRTLRDYQLRAIAETKDLIAAGKRRPIIVMPVGSGKTVTAAEIVYEQAAKGQRVLWVAHRRELIQQAVDTLRDRGCDVGTGGINEDAPVQVESIQFLTTASVVPPADYIIFDEGRHLVADDWGRLVEMYPDAILIALDATPERPDGRACGDVYDGMVVACQISDLILLNAREPTQGLVPCKVVRPEGGILKPHQLAQHPLDVYKERADGTQALVYAPSVQLAARWAEEFRRAGVRAEMVCAKTPRDERDSHVRRFRDGDLQVLFNKEIMVEGFDAPSTETIILARRTPHPSQFVQITGRGLRPSPQTGKTQALLLDLIGNAYVHGHPCRDRKYALEGIPIEQDTSAPIERFCSICYAPFVGGFCPRCPRGEGERFLTPPDPKIVDAELEEIEYDATTMKAPDIEAHVEPKDARIVHLADWMRDARKKGHNINMAKRRFHHRYGYWPSIKILDMAARLAEGTR